MPMPGYLATFLDVETALGEERALAFIADRAAEKIIPDIERSAQVQYISTAAGFAGSNIEYLENLASQLTVLGIEDRDLFTLLEDVRRVGSR
jgi:cation transport regulator ChaC